MNLNLSSQYIKGAKEFFRPLGELFISEKKTSNNTNQIDVTINKLSRTDHLNLERPLVKDGILEKAKRWSGISDIGTGIKEIKNGKYDNGFYHLATGSLRVIVLATLIVGCVKMISYQINPIDNHNPINNHNDVCQTPDMLHLCSGNLGISRINMPQVEGEVKEIFLKTLNSPVECTEIAANQLIPVQKEMNFKKVMGMIDGAKAGLFNPCDGEIIVVENQSSQLYVIDGHHRYAACRMLDGMQKIIKISSSSVLSILSALNKFPGVSKAHL